MKRGRVACDLPSWLVLGWSTWALGKFNLLFLRPPTCLNRWDEGYITAFAARMLRGHMLPYVDAVSQRGPLTYWLAAVAVWLGGWTSWLPMRCLGIGCMALTLGLTFAAARRAGHTLAGGVAALAMVYGLVIAMGPSDGLAFNGEHALNVFIMGAFLATTTALEQPRPSPGLVAAAGALAMMGVLCKQVGLATFAPIGLWVVATAAGRPGLTRQQRWSLPLAFAGGAAAPALVTVARYAAAGEVGTLWYWLYTYNAKIYMAPFTPSTKRRLIITFLSDHAGLVGAGALAVGWGLSQPFVRAPRLRDLARGYEEEGFTATVALGAVASLAAAVSPMRFFLHYFVQAIPWWGLLAGLVVERVLEGRGAGRPLLRAAVLLPATALLALVWRESYRSWRTTSESADWKQWQDGGASPICHEIASLSAAQDSLFVWGFAPDLYVRCQRFPASRYVFTSPLSGFVPFIPQPRELDDERAVPGSRETLLAELEAARPPVIVDVPSSLGKRSMLDYPVLAHYVEERYCPWRKIEEYTLLVRREGGKACPSPPPNIRGVNKTPPSLKGRPW